MQSVSLTDLLSFFTNSVFSSFSSFGHFSFHLLYGKGVSKSNERIRSSVENITSPLAWVRECIEVKDNAESVDAAKTFSARGRLSKDSIISAPFI